MESVIVLSIVAELLIWWWEFRHGIAFQKLGLTIPTVIVYK